MTALGICVEIVGALLSLASHSREGRIGTVLALAGATGLVSGVALALTGIAVSGAA